MKKSECNHEWGPEETLRDPNFQVAFGAKRECKICGQKQYADYCAGWCGGPWVNYMEENEPSLI